MVSNYVTLVSKYSKMERSWLAAMIPDIIITVCVGGTFALYSLICRYAKVALIPNDQPEDRELSNYKLDTPSTNLRRAYRIKEKLETSKTAKIVLFLVTILGTSMVIGDGVLTPCISVLSAVSGINSLGQSTPINK